MVWYIRKNKMWLALVFYCLTPEVTSCTLMANVNKLHVTEEECNVDARTMANSIMANGIFARAACFRVGKAT